MDRRWALFPVVMAMMFVAYQLSTLMQFVPLPSPGYTHRLFGIGHARTVVNQTAIGSVRTWVIETAIGSTQTIESNRTVVKQTAITNTQTVVNQKPTRPSKLEEHHYITLGFMGRLGNLLFEYASLYGISKWNNLTAAVTNDIAINKIFNLNCKKVHRFTVTFRRHIETAACAFDPRTKQLGSDKHVMLNGYYQSWKYFKHVEDDIRKQFAFQDVILKNAVTQFHSLIDKANVTMSSSSQTYVGVHVRRGDMVHSDAMVNYGYVAADVDYIQRALAYMQEKYKHVVFVVASDDMPWCIDNFPKNYKVMFIEQANSPEVDMAILTQCNHTVLTSGSFGWWSAWLNGGETIYYKGYPRPNSQLDNMIVAADYRPPEWIPM